MNIPPRLVTQPLLVHHRVALARQAVLRRAQVRVHHPVVRVPVQVVVRPRPVAQAHQAAALAHPRPVAQAHRQVLRVVVGTPVTRMKIVLMVRYAVLCGVTHGVCMKKIVGIIVRGLLVASIVLMTRGGDVIVTLTHVVKQDVTMDVKK